MEPIYACECGNEADCDCGFCTDHCHCPAPCSNVEYYDPDDYPEEYDDIDDVEVM